jgi:hypothetical protein
MEQSRISRRVWEVLNAAKIPRGDYRLSDDPEYLAAGSKVLYSRESVGSEEEEAFYSRVREILRQNGFLEVVHWVYRDASCSAAAHIIIFGAPD